MRAACLYYPLFLEHLRQEEAHFPHGRVNKQHVARQVLHPVATQLHIPKATLFTAVALMDVQRRFAESPKRGRGHRFVFHPAFPEALAFQRIVFTAEGGDMTLLNEWQALYEQEVARNAPPPPSDEHPDAEADEPRDAEEDRQAPRRRRRRRGPRTGGPRPDKDADTAHAITVTEVSQTAERDDGCD